MTLVLIGKDLVLEGSNPKIEDKQVPGRNPNFPCVFPERLGEGRFLGAVSLSSLT